MSVELTGPAGTRGVPHYTVRVVTNVAVFAAAAVLEIAGCFAFWLWLSTRRVVRGRATRNRELVGFAFSLTRVDSAFAGLAYAAYGGIYIAASLLWLWIAEHQRPSITDLVGGGLAVAGTLVIIGFAPKGR